MSRLVAVLDTAAIIGLAKGEVFSLVGDLYASVSVPPGVIEEVLVKGQGRPAVPELEQALGLWITEVAPEPHRLARFPATLSPADRGVLALVEMLTADHILSSDEALIREAGHRGLTCLRLTDLLLLFKHQGLVPAIRPVLDRMIEQVYGIWQEGAKHIPTPAKIVAWSPVPEYLWAVIRARVPEKNVARIQVHIHTEWAASGRDSRRTMASHRRSYVDKHGKSPRSKGAVVSNHTDETEH
jgi:uncharacterized protein